MRALPIAARSVPSLTPRPVSISTGAPRARASFAIASISVRVAGRGIGPGSPYSMPPASSIAPR